MSNPQAVDWFRLLWDLVQHGCGLSEISRRTGIAHGTLRGYLDGGHPNHWRGELLIALWIETTGRLRADVHMADVVLAPRVVTSRGIRAGSDAGRELERVWR